jgi:hypothetical protein
MRCVIDSLNPLKAGHLRTHLRGELIKRGLLSQSSSGATFRTVPIGKLTRAIIV